jgi:hypothetical protein
VIRLLNVLRWRLAQWVAPDPIVAMPADSTGEQGVWLLISRPPGYVWVEADSFRMRFYTAGIELPGGDPLARYTVMPTRGRFVGTVGAPPPWTRYTHDLPPELAEVMRRIDEDGFDQVGEKIH